MIVESKSTTNQGERKPMKLNALIVAGGTGNRMKSDIPKQFMLLNNKPILMHTIERFINFDSNIRITLVIPKEQFSYWNELCAKYQFNIPHKLVAGGKERFSSVKNGLDSLPDEGIVFIHDGVRPLVGKSTIKRCLATTLKKGNAVPVLPVVESIRKTDGTKNKIVDRSKYVTIQTPQVFHCQSIKKAYNQGYDPSFTDDTSVLESTGSSIHLVEGNRENLKITHPQDIVIAEALLSHLK